MIVNEIILSLSLFILFCFIFILPGTHINTFALFLSNIIKNNLVKSILLYLLALAMNLAEFLRVYLFKEVRPGYEFSLSFFKGEISNLEKLFKLSLYIYPLIVLMTPLFLFILPVIEKFSYPYSYFLLTAIFFILFVKSIKRKEDLLIFLLSCFLGILIFRIKSLPDPFYPLLTGIYGIPSLLIANKESTKNRIHMSKKREKLSWIDYIALTLILIILAFIPAITPTIALMFLLLFIPYNLINKLFLLVAINLGDVYISFITRKLFNKARLGAFSYITNLNNNNFVITILISMLIFPLLCIFYKEFVKCIRNYEYFINAKQTRYFIFLLLFLICFYYDGLCGIIIMIASTILGILCCELEVDIMYTIPSLIAPTLFYFFSYYLL